MTGLDLHVGVNVAVATRVCFDLPVFLGSLFLVFLLRFRLLRILAIFCIVTFHPTVVAGDLRYVFLFRVLLKLVFALLGGEGLSRFESIFLSELFFIVLLLE